MKKFLLLAASALLALPSAFAATSYIAGDIVTDLSQITDDGIYFLHAHKTERNKAGLISAVANYGNSGQFAKFYGGYLKDVPEEGVTNTNYLWRLKKVTDGEHAGGYTVQCVGAGQHYISNWGAVAEGKNNVTIEGVRDGAAVAGIFKLETLADGVAHKQPNRYLFHLDNGTFEGKGTKPYLMSNGQEGAGEENVAYWSYAQDNTGNLQIQIIKAVEVSDAPISVTVNLPAINGWPVTVEPMSIFAGQNVTTNINNKLIELGGMANATISSDNGSDMIVSSTNNSFTVTGTWDRELIANHIYRVMLKPNDRPAAMRYEVTTGYINTTSDHNTTDISTLNRLVPERLWVFRPVEGKAGVYTLHTLADPEKGVYIADATDNNNYAIATLSDAEHPATEFTVGKSTWNNTTDNIIGDFYLSYGADNGNYLNDRGIPGSGGTGGYVCQWRNSAAKSGVGSAFRLYPMTADDLQTLGVAAGTEPTIENLADAVIDFNATNVNAALRRIGYMNANNADLFGPYVGQWDNKQGTAKELYDHAVRISNGESASDAEKQAIVEGLDPQNITFKELVPNRFFRFKNKVSGKYISSTSSFTNTNGRAFMDLTSDGTRSNTVFLYHQEGEGDAAVNTLVCYDNGLVMPSFNGSNWVPVLKTDADAAQGTKLTYQDNGRYIIHISGTGDSHRHLYGAGDTQGNSPIVDAANNNTDDKYQWYVEEVTELPLTFFNVMNQEDYSDDGWASVYSPVALEIPAHYEHMTAYTGEFDGTDYTGKADINHVLATPIAPNAEGKVIIPANQPTLLFYDGELSFDENDNLSGSLIGRDDITYVNVNIVYDYENAIAAETNLSGSCFAASQAEGKEYYTLHATHSNNFRELSRYNNGYFDYIPGFKAYIENDPDGVDYYSIYLVNPNTMAPDVESEGVKVEQGDSEGQWKVTITTPGEDFEVYYKHTPANDVQDVRRKAHEAEGYTKADNTTDTHTFSVTPGKVEYHTYHPATDTQSVERVFTINADGSTTNLKSVIVNANGKAECFDLMGRRLAAPVKGINIVNNKKVLVK